MNQKSFTHPFNWSIINQSDVKSAHSREFSVCMGFYVFYIRNYMFIYPFDSCQKRLWDTLEKRLENLISKQDPQNTPKKVFYST